MVLQQSIMKNRWSKLIVIIYVIICIVHLNPCIFHNASSTQKDSTFQIWHLPLVILESRVSSGPQTVCELAVWKCQAFATAADIKIFVYTLGCSPAQ